MTESAIERELLDATNLTYQGKNRQKQLHALAHAVNKLDDEAWRKLGKTAQEWYNEASLAIDNKQNIHDFSDVGGSTEAAMPEKLEKTTMAKGKVTKAASAQGNGKTARVAAAPRKAAAAKKIVRAEHGGGSTSLIHSALVKNPNLTTAELVEKLAAKGNTASKFTIGTLRSRAVDLMKRLHAAGHLKGLSLS